MPTSRTFISVHACNVRRLSDMAIHDLVVVASSSFHPFPAPQQAAGFALAVPSSVATSASSWICFGCSLICDDLSKQLDLLWLFPHLWRPQQAAGFALAVPSSVATSASSWICFGCSLICADLRGAVPASLVPPSPPPRPAKTRPKTGARVHRKRPSSHRW